MALGRCPRANLSQFSGFTGGKAPAELVTAEAPARSPPGRASSDVGPSGDRFRRCWRGFPVSSGDFGGRFGGGFRVVWGCPGSGNPSGRPSKALAEARRACSDLGPSGDRFRERWRSFPVSSKGFRGRFGWACPGDKDGFPGSGAPVTRFERSCGHPQRSPSPRRASSDLGPSGDGFRGC